MPTQETQLRDKFFLYLFGETEGYFCVATLPESGAKAQFKQSFFKWPDQRAEISSFIDGLKKKNIFFCVNLLSKPTRTKENCLPSRLVWSDLDTAKPDDLNPPPQVVIESSTERYQAIWRLNEEISPQLAEEYSRKIAYKYSNNGADTGCWNLGRLLRVPLTYNYKYGSIPQVRLLRAEEDTIGVDVFENMILEEIITPKGQEPLPEVDDLPDPENIIYEYRYKLKDTYFKELYHVEADPNEDWSKVLWRIINICIEAGMTKEEAFVIAANSPYNKYARDSRPVRHLWQDVIKAFNAKDSFVVIAGELDNNLIFPELVTEDEYDGLDDTFLDEYRSWGAEATDACVEYHELAGAILLSSVLASGLHVKTSFGKVVPNLWGLILGESGVTRKTTAMRMATDFITDLDPNVLLATSGSVEGILTGLSERPNKTSMFFRDEVAGFFDEIQRKDYLSGMAEALAHLYDCPAVDHRRLRKETITIVNPVFIFFGGGIRDRVYESVREDLFHSGFLPRFLIVSGEANLDSIRPIGPPPTGSKLESKQEKLRIQLGELHEMYSKTVMMKIGSQETEVNKDIEAILTPVAWKRVGEMEMLLIKTANESAHSSTALPTFIRTSTAILKLAILIGATRQEPSKKFQIKIEERDVVHAAKYIQSWGKHTAHMISNTGKTMTERTLDKILKAVRTHPGITRSDVMRRHHLTSQDANITLGTLEDRGLITLKKEGRGVRLWPV